MIFFPVRAEIPYFSDLKLGGTAGGLREAVFYFETFNFPKTFTLTSFTNTKIQSPQVPPTSDLKSMESQLSLEKNHKKIFFSSVFNFTWSFVNLVWYSVDEIIWFWARNNLSNTRPNIWISYHFKKLSKKDINIIFFQWKLRLHTFQIWHLGECRGT